ncbi:MAG: YitT family protein [Bacteroidales bacterium]|nr:YitT family protein [Bacteroidales bacterium]
MSFLPSYKVFSRKWFINYSYIIIGAFLLAAGFVFFITPYKIVPGGVYGISIVIHYMTQGIFSFAPEGLPIGTVGFILNIPLTIIGIKVLGPRFGLKTIIGFFLTSFFIDFQTYLWGYKPLVPDDPLISSIFGALLFGIGMGLIFKSQASSGGTDIIGMIIFKYTHLPIGQAIIIVDSFVVLLGLAVFKDWKIPLYSWLVIFITGRVIDAVMQGINYEKAVYIISDEYESIRKKILVDLGRGGTLIVGKGMYEGHERKMIYTVISRRELAILRDFVKEVDPKAFMVVINANEVLGEGFKPLVEE